MEIVDNGFGDVVDNLVKVIKPFANALVGLAVTGVRKANLLLFNAGRNENNDNLDAIFLNPIMPFSWEKNGVFNTIIFFNFFVKSKVGSLLNIKITRNQF